MKGGWKEALTFLLIPLILNAEFLGTSMLFNVLLLFFVPKVFKLPWLIRTIVVVLASSEVIPGISHQMNLKV